MKRSSSVAVAVTALALGATTAAFAGSTPPSNDGTAHMPTSPTSQAPSTTPPSNQGTAHRPSTPGPSVSLSAKAKAYGKYCQGESKKHVAGTPGTPFSACVTAMAKVAHDQAGPRAACKTESKKHVGGSKGTAFSICVSGAAKLRHDQATSSS